MERIYTKADMEAACELVRASNRLAEKLTLDRMVDRFVAWNLPDSVCSDPCVTQRGYPHRIGTSLLTADEARQMLMHVLNLETGPDSTDEMRIQCPKCSKPVNYVYCPYCGADQEKP